MTEKLFTRELFFHWTVRRLRWLVRGDIRELGRSQYETSSLETSPKFHRGMKFICASGVYFTAVLAKEKFRARTYDKSSDCSKTISGGEVAIVETGKSAEVYQRAWLQRLGDLRHVFEK